MRRGRTTFLFVFLFFGTLNAGEKPFYTDGKYLNHIQSPQAFLGYKLGERFTPHYRIVDYLHYLAGASNRVLIHQYGETYEGRPLLYLIISSPSNLDSLEAIRRRLLSLREPQKLTDADKLFRETPAVVWLSYGVHGNESSSSEAAMQVAYQLAAGADSVTLNILTHTVVILDPLLNPDGRDRYVNWFTGQAGKVLNPDPNAIEHDEPWPGGRTNHYYFDLNREWAWMTQRESRARVELYRKWYPQVHVDFHEMRYTSTYFFFPPHGPILTEIPPETKKWMQLYGESNARAFDRYGWLYYTSEDYDMFYPGYGDSWPTLNGAIGMTYEQAGGGRAGLLVERPDKTLLTLRDRIHHHFISSMATLATTAKHREARLRDFRKFFMTFYREAKRAGFDAYVVLPGSSKEKFHDFTQKLLQQGIEIYAFNHSIQVKRAVNLLSQKQEDIMIRAGTLYLPLHQPAGRLLKVLFEPSPALSDTFFYDITSWSYPIAFGLNAYKVKGSWPEKVLKIEHPPELTQKTEKEQARYAYVLSWDDYRSAGFLSDLLEKEVRCYVALKPFSLNGRTFKRGDVVIPVSVNQEHGALYRWIQDLARKWEVELFAANSALTERGIDLGSRNMRWIRPPRVAMLADEPVLPYNYGAIWHLLDQQMEMPVSGLRISRLNKVDLKKYNVLIFPDASGRYESYLDSITTARLKRWVQDGGVVIGMGEGARILVQKKLSRVSLKKERKAKQDTLAARKEREERQRRARLTWEQKQKERIKDRVPGAVMKLILDTTHPLAFGHPKESFLLKRNRLAFEINDTAHLVGRLPHRAHLSGYLNERNARLLENAAVITVEPSGRGKIILFTDDVVFRLFWRATTGLLINAVMFGSIM